MPCSCCDYWYESDIVKRDGSNFVRNCKITDKKISSDSEPCKYFKPTFFYCDKIGQRLSFTQCIARRRNEKGLASYDQCKKCRQFDKEIREIIEKYFLDMVPIVTPRNIQTSSSESNTRKIKRRENKPKSIKRRTEQQTTRKIKRRRRSELEKALKSIMKTKTTRKIKRR